MSPGADRKGGLWIENNQISITSNGHRTLFGEKAKELCRSCGDQFHEAIQAKTFFVNCFMEEQYEAVLDSRSPVGYGCKAVLPHILLPFEVKGTMVCGDHLEVSGCEAFP